MSKRSLIVLALTVFGALGVFVWAKSGAQGPAATPKVVAEPELAGAGTEGALAVQREAIEKAERLELASLLPAPSDPSRALPGATNAATNAAATPDAPTKAPPPPDPTSKSDPKGKIGVAFTAHVNGETEPCG